MQQTFCCPGWPDFTLAKRLLESRCSPRGFCVFSLLLRSVSRSIQLEMVLNLALSNFLVSPLRPAPTKQKSCPYTWADNFAIIPPPNRTGRPPKPHARQQENPPPHSPGATTRPPVPHPIPSSFAQQCRRRALPPCVSNAVCRAPPPPPRQQSKEASSQISLLRVFFPPPPACVCLHHVCVWWQGRAAACVLPVSPLPLRRRQPLPPPPPPPGSVLTCAGKGGNVCPTWKEVAGGKREGAAADSHSGMIQRQKWADYGVS